MADTKKIQTSVRFNTLTLERLNNIADSEGVNRTTALTNLITQAHWRKVNEVVGELNRENRNTTPGAFNAALAACRGGSGNFLRAVSNVHDTMDFAIQSIRSQLGDGYADSDVIALTKLMMDENARLDNLDR